MKKLRCRELGFDCEAVVEGQTVDDVLAQAGPHARDVHGVDVTPEVSEQFAAQIRDA